MVKCGRCKKEVASVDCIHCYKCGIVLHEACLDWQDTADGKIIVCDKCKVQIELPIEYCPGEASTSQAPDSTEVKYSGLDRELTCILFPGIVKNSEKAIQCLGGIKGISQVCNLFFIILLRPTVGQSLIGTYYFGISNWV